MPTLADIAGAQLPSEHSLDGENARACWEGETFERTAPLLWEYGRNEEFFRYPGNPNNRSPNVAVLEDNWKLLVNADNTSLELYDLANDPNETTNVAEQHATTAERLKTIALQWRASLNDAPRE